ncbi:MAG: type II toxin-antitoxin system HicA family toxin [Phormidesmis sp.]
MPKPLSRRHRKTLVDIWKIPPIANLKWNRVEALIRAVGGRVEQGKGSRVRFIIDGRVGRFHTPHKNGVNTDKGAISSLKKYLTDCGITPDSTQDEDVDDA